MIPNQKIKETLNLLSEDITLTYKLISLKQLDDSNGTRKSFYVTKSLTTIWQLTSVWVLSPERQAKVAKSKANESFRINGFLLLCLPSRNSSKHAKHFYFSCWSLDEIMRLFLYSCPSYLYARSSVVFWVNCFGYFSSFLKLSLSLPHGIVRYCYISYLLPWLD